MPSIFIIKNIKNFNKGINIRQIFCNDFIIIIGKTTRYILELGGIGIST